MNRSSPRSFGLVAGSLLLATVMAAGLDAQSMPEVMPIDRTLPIKAGFDIDRAYIGARPLFTPLRDPTFGQLRAALGADQVASDTPVLVFEAGGKTLALVTSQMSYHHVAQGEMAGEPWMVTF